MGATIRCSLSLWTSSFSLPFYPNVVPAPAFSAAWFCSAFRESCHRKIISHSDGHSVVIDKTKKADTQRHQKSTGVLLSLQNDVLCNGFEFQRRDCFSSVHLLTVPKSIEYRRRYFLLAYTQALVGLHRIPNPNILYSVLTLIQEGFHYIKTIAENQVFGKILYSFCKSRSYYFVTLSVKRPIIGKYMLK